MTHRPVGTGQVRGPDKPSQALTLEGIVDASSGRLPGKLQAADEKEEQHLAFSERGRRARTQCPFFLMQAIFVQPFIRFFFLLSQQNSFVVIDINIIFFIQNKISIYMILSFLTMYRSAKKSTFITLVALEIPPHPTLCLFAVGRVRGRSSTRHIHLTPASNVPQKSDQICSLFSNMAQFPGRVKILKQQFTI